MPTGFSPKPAEPISCRHGDYVTVKKLNKALCTLSSSLTAPQLGDLPVDGEHGRRRSFPSHGPHLPRSDPHHHQMSLEKKDTIHMHCLKGDQFSGHRLCVASNPIVQAILCKPSLNRRSRMLSLLKKCTSWITSVHCCLAAAGPCCQ